MHVPVQLTDKRTLAAALVLVAFGATALPASRALAQGTGHAPTSVVEALHDGILAAMRDGDALGFDGRADALRPLVERSFDFAYISRLVIGDAWRALGKPDRARMRDTMARLTVTTYAARFNAFDGERFETIGSAEGRRGRWRVKTRLVLELEDDVALDYVLHEADGEWRIVNIVANGVSDLSIKRAEYSGIVNTKGFDALLEALDKQDEALGRKARGQGAAGRS